MKYRFIEKETMNYSTAALCRVLGVSRSGYYDWKHRKPSRRTIENRQLLQRILVLHKEHK